MAEKIRDIVFRCILLLFLVFCSELKCCSVEEKRNKELPDTDDVRFMKSDVMQIKVALNENAEAVDEMKKSLNNVNLQLKRIGELLTNDSTKDVSIKDHCLDHDSICTIFSNCSSLLQTIHILYEKSKIDKTSGIESMKDNSTLLQHSQLCGSESIGAHVVPKVCCSLKTKSDDQVRFETHRSRHLLAKSCPAKQNNRIIGGTEAPIGEYPWLALLGYTQRISGPVRFLCGGSLIGDRYVITASHCVTGLPNSYRLVRVRFGEHTISHSGPDCPSNFVKHGCNVGVQDIDVEKIVTHPSYSSSTYQNDIAIIRLKNKVLENDYVKPICLPYEDDLDEEYQLNNLGNRLKTWVAGWGATDPDNHGIVADSLQHINLTVFDANECRNAYRKRGAVISKDSQLCVGGEKGRDSCVGDSGSALVTSSKKSENALLTWKLLGIVSFGPKKCGTENVPGVYTKVRNYIDWTLDNIEA